MESLAADGDDDGEPFEIHGLGEVCSAEYNAQTNSVRAADVALTNATKNGTLDGCHSLYRNVSKKGSASYDRVCNIYSVLPSLPRFWEGNGTGT